MVMSKNDVQPTNQDILEAVNQFATDITVDIHDIKQDITGLKQNVSSLKQDVSGLKQDVGGLKQDFNSLQQDVSTLKEDMVTVKSTMVTKSYLDEKLSDLRGDLTMLVRKEDNKFTVLVDTLHNKKVLTASEVGRILALEPFPKASTF